MPECHSALCVALCDAVRGCKSEDVACNLALHGMLARLQQQVVSCASVWVTHERCLTAQGSAGMTQISGQESCKAIYRHAGWKHAHAGWRSHLKPRSRSRLQARQKGSRKLKCLLPVYTWVADRTLLGSQGLGAPQAKLSCVALSVQGPAHNCLSRHMCAKSVHKVCRLVC